VSILLLSKGDEKAKYLLRNAIAAHYGNHPTAFESIHMKLDGRVAQHTRFMKLWLDLNLDIHFQFPSQFRQDYRANFLKLPVMNISEAFDNQVYYQKNRNQPVMQTTDTAYLATVQERLWSYATMLLIPLSEVFVQLSYQGMLCFTAYNLKTCISSTIQLYDNYQLKQITVTSHETQSTFQLELSQETNNINDVKIFKHIQVLLDGVFVYDLYPAEVNLESEFDEGIFQIT